VNYSWQRFNGKAPGTQPSVAVGNLANIDSLTTPDAQSVVIKLKAPDASILNRLGDEYNMLLMPKETGTAFDPTKTLVGSGPWIFVSTDANVSKFKRNPTWHFGPDLPYMDGVEGYVFTDFAPALTQFQGGNLDLLQGFQHADDYKNAKANVKGLQFQPIYSPFMAYVSFQMNDKSGQWQDPRVRQAISMSLDRNAIFEAVYDTTGFKALGVDIPVVQHNFMPAGFGPDWWLDPNGTKIDPAVKPFWQYSPDDAKKLLSAAGFPNGFSVNYHYTTGFGPDFAKAAELTGEYITKIGIKLNVIVEDANSVYFPKTFLGNYDGIAYQYEGLSTPQETLSLMYLPGGSRNHSNVNDPDVTAQINAFVAELDPKKAQQLAYDFQNKQGQKFYYAPAVYNAGPSFTGAYPYVGGFGQWNALRTGGYSVTYSHYGLNK
jgi:peptide/nickel transport system substrate-binding protein